jgi:sodium/potassium-transporting ATPase subunit alpha
MEILKEENKLEAKKQRYISERLYGQPEPPKDVAMTMGLRMRKSFVTFQYDAGQMFTRAYWRRLFMHRDEEVLVDGNVLSWAYLECGILEALGCLATFFFVFWYEAGWTPAMVREKAQLANTLKSEEIDALYTYNDVNVLKVAQSAYFLAILIQQCFNHFICKVSLRLPFGKMVFRNRATWYGMIAGIAFAIFIVYTPGVQIPFNTANVNPLYWLLPMAMGVVMVAYASARIAYLRRRMPLNANLALPLDLHPTRWSTKSVQ